MTTSSSSAPSRPLSRSEWVSTLPPWRRLLATLNWRPVYDIEQRELESRKRTRLLEMSGDIENWTRSDTKTGPPR